MGCKSSNLAYFFCSFDIVYAVILNLEKQYVSSCKINCEYVLISILGILKRLIQLCSGPDNYSSLYHSCSKHRESIRLPHDAAVFLYTTKSSDIYTLK